ncbi:hypothetical protein O1W17_40015 [Streptomyces sp. H34-S5]|nr:hypothetical protein [Streptomyces sp. H34-S5]MCZ4088071.1 hypothetical protein [Streptomyces sp. H34-S5]
MAAWAKEIEPNPVRNSRTGHRDEQRRARDDREGRLDAEGGDERLGQDRGQELPEEQGGGQQARVPGAYVGGRFGEDPVVEVRHQETEAGARDQQRHDQHRHVGRDREHQVAEADGEEGERGERVLPREPQLTGERQPGRTRPHDIHGSVHTPRPRHSQGPFQRNVLMSLRDKGEGDNAFPFRPR